MSGGWQMSTKCASINHFRRPRNVVRKPEEAGKEGQIPMREMLSLQAVKYQTPM